MEREEKHAWEDRGTGEEEKVHRKQEGNILRMGRRTERKEEKIEAEKKKEEDGTIEQEEKRK